MLLRVLSAAFALGLIAPAGAEDPDAILKWAFREKGCVRAQTAQGWEAHRVSPASDLTGTAADSLSIVDRSRRRMVSLVRQTDPDDPDDWTVTRQAYADGVFYLCTARRAETCRLRPVPQESVTPEDITSAYVAFGDLRAPDRGGARIEMADIPPDMTDIAWAVALTPRGGRPYVLYIAADGAILATDMPGPVRTQRNWLTDYALTDGCWMPATSRIEILPDAPGRYLEWRLDRLTWRDWMTPEETAFE